ncbi:MAG: phage portal protein [Proteobacteria bacterium]|nr:phage portal protein [Pseudomonadota bacterium]
MVNEKLQLAIAQATGGSSIPDVILPPVNVDGNFDAVDIDMLQAYAGQTSFSNHEMSIYDGAKFSGGFGLTQVQTVDYWTLRARSSQLFNENLYARGLIRRLVTNEINTGLTPESMPDETIIGVEENSLTDWTEDVETRFGLWGKNPKLCDFKGVSTFGDLQRTIRREAIVSGDILVVLRRNSTTNLPQVQLINGNKVQTPFGDDAKWRKGHDVKHGVEFDRLGRVVAHWIKQDNGAGFKRMPAFGEKSGRRISWLVYGTDKRLDDVRGQPILALVMQSLKEVDRYRDSAQRKAVINSLIAMSVEKTNEKMGTLPGQGGAVRNDTATVTDGDTGTRKLNVAQYLPGITVDEMQVGETLNMHGGQGTDVNFPAFEEAIITAIAWANEIPPEILRLAFSNNYSASQAAINEFKIYLNRVWSDFGETVCTPIYIEWLLAETLTQKIIAPGLLQAWRTATQYDIFGAWVMVDWYGSIKPSTDALKQGKGSELYLKLGLTTHAREARNATGSKFSTNVKRLKTENELLAEAMRPMLELQAEFGPDETDKALEAVNEAATTLHAVADDLNN